MNYKYQITSDEIDKVILLKDPHNPVYFGNINDQTIKINPENIDHEGYRMLMNNNRHMMLVNLVDITRVTHTDSE